MHWYCYNNAVRLLNKAKSGLFQSIMNFENRMDFVCQPANQPYVRPGYARSMAPEVLHSKGNPVGYTKLLFR